jgi:hypothetical protein
MLERDKVQKIRKMQKYEISKTVNIFFFAAVCRLLIEKKNP